MNEIDIINNEFIRWIGYCEKNKLSDIGESMDKPENFTLNAGTKNYTIFAKDLKKWTGIDVQGMAWCDTFIDAVFIYKLGVTRARSLLGGFSAWTPESAFFFQKNSRFYTSNPKEGDIIFFHNTERICHTGFVRGVYGQRIMTIEGNTSNKQSLVVNGGMVAIKEYNIEDDSISGYGRPDFIQFGWIYTPDGWRYLKENGQFAKSCFAEYNGLRYYFNDKGIMATGQIFVDGVRHVFSKSEYEGAEFFINNTLDFREVKL